MTSEGDRPPGGPELPQGRPSPPPAGPRRLHPAEIILASLDNARDALIAIVVAVIGAASGSFGAAGLAALAVAGLVVAAVAGYVRWQHTTYEVRGPSLVFRRGVLSPDETAVPLGRVHAIDTSQGPIQRLFGVHELHVQTAGGGARGEIKLRAVTDADAAWLRAAAGLAEPAERELPGWRLGGRRLLVTALTAPQVGMLAPIAGGIAALADNVLGNSGRDLVERAPTDTGSIVLIACALLAGAWLISFAGAIVAFGGFEVVRDGDRLRIRRGVLQRRASSIPVTRVHAVVVVEGILRRPFGLASVRLETAGYRDEPAAAQTLLPLTRLTEVDATLRELVPALAPGTGRLEPPPQRARPRYAIPGVVAALAAGVAATAVWPQAWPALVLLPAMAVAEALGRHRAAGWRLEGGLVLLRGRRLARRTLVARIERLQEHRVRQTILQRRAGFADVAVAVGSGHEGGVRYLEQPTALDLFDRLR
ncbi:MAG TPA: PH domain-containing protein [Thermoleophilaceae bacterium]